MPARCAAFRGAPRARALKGPLELLITRPAERDIGRLDPPVRRRLLAALDRLALEPKGPGTAALVGRDGRRPRVGDWRVLTASATTRGP